MEHGCRISLAGDSADVPFFFGLGLQDGHVATSCLLICSNINSSSGRNSSKSTGNGNKCHKISDCDSRSSLETEKNHSCNIQNLFTLPTIILTRVVIATIAMIMVILGRVTMTANTILTVITLLIMMTTIFMTRKTSTTPNIIKVMLIITKNEFNNIRDTQ